MPVLSNDPKKTLTYGEYRQRLLEKFEKNPNDPDPEVQEFKKAIAKSLSVVNQNFSLAMTSTLQNVIVDYNQNLIAAIGAAIKPSFPTAFLLSEALKPSLALTELANAIAESNRRIIEGFKIPNYLFESIKMLSEQINQLYEPARLLGQTFAMYKTPNLFNQLTILNTNWIIPGYIPTKDISDKEHYKAVLDDEAEVFSVEMDNLRAAEPQINNSPYTYYKPTQFLLLNIQVVVAIPFYTKRDTTNVLMLFESVFELLEERGQVIGDFKRVFISKTELIAKLITKGVKEPTEDWLKRAKNSFMNHKIKPLVGRFPVIQDAISLWYDKSDEGY